MGVEGVSSTNTSSIIPPLKPSDSTKSSATTDIWSEAKATPKFVPSTSSESKAEDVKVPYRP